MERTHRQQVINQECRQKTGKTAVSALICTRNRGATAAAAVRAVLENAFDDFELLVIDQSDNNETEQALLPLCADSRLRVIRTDTVGKGRALNLGLSLAQADIVAMTDDDCLVPPNWLAKITAVFDQHPQVAITFTNVVAVDHDHSAGFVPSWSFPSNRIVTHLSDIPWGMGASMAVRKQVVLEMGGFDERLGPGGDFFSGDETDLMLRMLLDNHAVYELGETAVYHDGFRTWAQGATLMRRDWFALGAVYAKLMRLAPKQSASFVWHEIRYKLLRPPIQDFVVEQQLKGLVPIRAFVQGFWRGWHTPIDPATYRFQFAKTQGGP